MSKYYNKNKSLITNLINCLNTNKTFYAIFFGIAAYVSIITDDFKRGIFTIVFMVLFSYLSHIAGHKLYPINLFHGLHHQDEHNKKWWARLVEWVVNLIQIGGILLIPLNIYLSNSRYLGYKVLNNYIILYFSLVYTTHHMINYHLMKVDTHVRHHKNTNTNFGPDYMDVLFGTKQHNSTFEEMEESITNSLVSGVIVILVFYILSNKNINF
jgi:sterol desaturase/sphingolipid hydroxylase (fatty acid hydroxylase superfamily)